MLGVVMLGCGSAQPISHTSTESDDGLEGSETRDTRGLYGGARDVPTTEAGGGGACQLPVIYFAYDSDDLDAASRDALQASARCLQAGGGEVLFTGSTDPRGTEEYNLALGDRRAATVKRYLESLGVRQNVRTRSVGEEWARGTDESGWARDRRVEGERPSSR